MGRRRRSQVDKPRIDVIKQRAAVIRARRFKRGSRERARAAALGGTGNDQPRLDEVADLPGSTDPIAMPRPDDEPRADRYEDLEAEVDFGGEP